MVNSSSSGASSTFEEDPAIFTFSKALYCRLGVVTEFTLGPGGPGGPWRMGKNRY